MSTGPLHRVRLLGVGACLAAASGAFAATTAPASRPAGREQNAAGPAEAEDLELLTLEVPTVVTASRHEQRITDVPAAMSVITAEDIRRAGARSVPDALRLVPDLASGAHAVSPRGYQGFLSNGVLVLVDGRQIFDSVFGGTLWHSWPFQLEDIERIEVIRGPGGVTWGANTLNGVINIITKDPAEQQGLTFIGGGGSRGSQKEHLGYGFSDGKLRLRVSGEYEGNDGFVHGGSWLRGLDDDYKAGRMGVHAVYDAGPRDKLTLSGGSALLDGGYPPPPGAGFGLSHNSGSQANYLLARWDHAVADDNRWMLTGFVNDFQASPGVPAIDYRYQQLALQLGHTFRPTPNHTLTWGIDARTDLVDASGADPFMLTEDFLSTAIFGLYVQDEWRFAPRWALTAGARIDYEFYGGFQPSARVSLSHELADKSFVYGAVSRAFQAPSVGARFLDTPMLNGLARVTGRGDVPEASVLAYEQGWRKKFLDRLDIGANLFWNDYRRLPALVPKPGPPALFGFDYDSAASSQMYGAEFDAKYAVLRNLTLLGHYTFQQFDWDSSVRPMQKDIMTPPKHKFMLGTRYDPLDDLHLSAHLYYVDAVQAPNPANPFVPCPVPHYFRLDLRAEYEFWNKRASVAVGVRNLLDPSHREGGTMFLSDAEVPRMVYAEMRVTFK